jgi:hypothetical protein
MLNETDILDSLFYDIGDWTQGFVLARQVLYHLNKPPPAPPQSLFCFCFQIGSSTNFP